MNKTLIITLLIFLFSPSFALACFSYCGMRLEKIYIVKNQGDTFIIEQEIKSPNNIRHGPDIRYKIRLNTGKLVAALPVFEREKHWNFTCADFSNCHATYYDFPKLERWVLDKDELLKNAQILPNFETDYIREQFENYLSGENNTLYTSQYYGEKINGNTLSFNHIEYGPIKSFFMAFIYLPYQMIAEIIVAISASAALILFIINPSIVLTKLFFKYTFFKSPKP